MGQQGCGPSRCRFGLPDRSQLDVTSGKSGQPCQRPQRSREAVTRQHTHLFCRIMNLDQPRSSDLLIRKEPSCCVELRVRRTEELRCHVEQSQPPIRNPLNIRFLVEQGRPAIFERGQHCSPDPTRKQFDGCGLQPWLGRRWIGVETLQCLSPPGEANCAQRRLGRAGHNFGQCVVDRKQRIESGPEFDRPVEPDEIAVRQLSDTKPPWPPSRRHRN